MFEKLLDDIAECNKLVDEVNDELKRILREDRRSTVEIAKSLKQSSNKPVKVEREKKQRVFLTPSA